MPGPMEPFLLLLDYFCTDVHRKKYKVLKLVEFTEINNLMRKTHFNKYLNINLSLSKAFKLYS